MELTFASIVVFIVVVYLLVLTVTGGHSKAELGKFYVRRTSASGRTYYINSRGIRRYTKN
jgi:hypothetical protein